MTRPTLFGLIGDPVAHSRSPGLHAAAYRALGVDAVYVAFRIEPGALGDSLDALFRLGAGGLNVTVPHKRAVLPYLVSVEPAAEAIGAVNTLVRGDGGWVGANTDADGLVWSLRDAGLSLDGRRVTVLGAGGAARAAVVGLLEAGARTVRVVARRSDAAEAVVRDAATLGRGALRAAAWAPGALADAFRDTDLLVQSTSAPLGGPEADRTFAAGLPLDMLPSGAAVVDLVYGQPTAILAAAEARGLTTLDGLGMLIGQAALAMARWLGQPVPAEVVRAAFLSRSS